MLVLSRKKNESLVLNNTITLTVVEIRGDKVRLGITCPREVSVHRQEVFDAIYGARPSAPPCRSPEENAFLQGIQEKPEDEGLRLIFADWLEERGDPLAELIRTQCRLAKLPPGDQGRKNLEMRQGLLWAEHGAAWRAALPAVLWSGPADGGSSF
jgi:carbon storage regulator